MRRMGRRKRWTRTGNQSGGCQRARSTSTWCIYLQEWWKKRRPGWSVQEERGKRKLGVYPQPVHMLAEVRGGPEVVELNEYLEGKVGQRIH